MSALPGIARRRRDAEPTVSLQARIPVAIRTQLVDAAQRSGVSLAYYLEIYFREQLQQGPLPLVEKPRPQREELPIPAA